MKTLISCLLLLNLTAYAESKGGGGGGGICFNNKCQTLAEAGFRIQDQENEVVISGELMDEVDKIVKILTPDSGFISQEIIGKPGDIRIVEAIDQRKTKKFLKQYRSILKREGSTFTNSVKLLGITCNPSKNSSELVTYLIREQFEALSLRGRALLLIHESGLRVRRLPLEQVLRLDGAIIEYVNSVEQGTPKKREFIQALRASGGQVPKGPYASIQPWNDYQFNEFLRDIGGALELDKKWGLKINGNNWNNGFAGDVTLTYDALLRLRKLDENVIQDVSPAKLGSFGQTLHRGSMVFHYVEHIASVTPPPRKAYYVASQQDFEAFVIRKFGAGALQAGKSCKSEGQEFLFSRGGTQEFASPGRFSCHLDMTIFRRYSEHFDFADGLEFKNIGKGIKCYFLLENIFSCYPI